MIKIDLPWPPSINHYWRRVGARTLISKEGRQYREAVGKTWLLTRGMGGVDGRIRAEIWAFPPDRRKRDLDNLLKATLDALQHAGAYTDDSQIDDLRIIRCDPNKPGYLTIALWETEPLPERWALDNVS